MSDTPSQSFASFRTHRSHQTSITSPQMPSPHTHSGAADDADASFAKDGSRPSYLDVSALSPREFDVYTRWASRIKPAHSRRQGFLDEHAAVKFLRCELGISVDHEVQILSLFERLPLGIKYGHFYAMLRLAAWAQRGHAITRDLLFVQTEPAESRRRRRGRPSSTLTAAPMADADMTPMVTAMPVSLEVPKAPPRQLPDDHELVRHHSGSDLDHGKVVYSPPESHLVRPMPVVARPATNKAPPLDDADAQRPERPPLMTESHPLLRPSAPMPLAQQVSPLIQASLNARSQFKKASRTSRPKTFTVLSSSSGQFQRDKPHLLNGEEISPHALSPDTKRRSTSATKLSSLIASQDFKPGAPPLRAGMSGQTIAPKPSYFGRERGVLPAWLREQYEEGNVLYPPPDPADPSVTSVYDALDNKAHNTMNGSERAAASINRHTPFFPPHQRDLERAELTTLSANGPAQYKKLNEETSVGKRTSNDSLTQERGAKLLGSRSKSTLNTKGRRLEHSPSQNWGTQLESGTYAGFKSTPSSRDLRLQPLARVSAKRSFQIRPTQEFQPILAPLPAETAVHHAQESTGDTDNKPPAPLRAQDDLRTEWLLRAHDLPPRLTRSHSLNMRQPEVHRFKLQGDATRPQLTYKQERKPSGSMTFGTSMARRVSQKHMTSHDESSAERASRPLPQAPDTPHESKPEAAVPYKPRHASTAKLNAVIRKHEEDEARQKESSASQEAMTVDPAKDDEPHETKEEPNVPPEPPARRESEEPSTADDPPTPGDLNQHEEESPPSQPPADPVETNVTKEATPLSDRES